MLKKYFKISVLTTISIFFLTNCDPNNDNNIQLEPEKLPIPLADVNNNINNQEIEPGAYCFENKKTKQNKKTAQILIAADYTVTGIIDNSNNPATKQLNNDNSEYREFIAGVLEKSQLEVTINREKEAKNKERKETWLLTLNSLITSQETYQKINCEELIE